MSTLLTVLAQASSRFQAEVAIAMHWIVVSPPHLPDFVSCELSTTAFNAGTAISRHSPVMALVAVV